MEKCKSSITGRPAKKGWLPWGRSGMYVAGLGEYHPDDFRITFTWDAPGDGAGVMHRPSGLNAFSYKGISTGENLDMAWCRLLDRLAKANL